jgi:hypothetical protein
VNSICILVSTWLIWINPQPSQLDSDQFLWDFSGFLPKNVRYQRLRVWAWRPELPQGRCSAPCLRRASAAAVPWGSVWWSASRHGAGGEETWPVERWPKSEGWDGWWLSHLFNSNIYELYNIIHKLYCNNGIYIYYAIWYAQCTEKVRLDSLAWDHPGKMTMLDNTGEGAWNTDFFPSVIIRANPHPSWLGKIMEDQQR